MYETFSLKIKVNLVLHGFCFTLPHDLSSKLVPPFQLFRSKTKAYHDLLFYIFLPFRQYAYFHLGFS